MASHSSAPVREHTRHTINEISGIMIELRPINP
jgi:hypothetical protein